MIKRKTDKTTRHWVRNRSDELAIEAGCRFDEERAAHVCDFFEQELRLYEGECAGQPFLLMDWERDLLSRCFGWVRFSEDWGRNIRRFRKASIWVPKKNGKALALDTPIPTPDGWTTVGQLQVGDCLFDSSGRVCRVTQLHPIESMKANTVRFSNGDSIVCNDEHLWVTTNLQNAVGSRSRERVFAGNQHTGKLRGQAPRTATRTTREIRETLLRGDGARNHSVSLPGPIQCDERWSSGNQMKARSRTVQITAVEPAPEVLMRCISVDSPDGTFLCGSSMLPTHNSPIAAGVGLYLLAWDGEIGQKVFSAAKDGRQAQIVHTHAQQMVKRCPALRDVCTINRRDGTITLEALTADGVENLSTYRILAGDNIEGQEGLNGSVVVDETHVVDMRLLKVLEYMGASRSEPMQFEVSTAGNDPEGYGRRQWDYGRQVERGDVVDHEFLFIHYGVEHGATDEDCEDPKVWEAANPSWGVTIKPEEFRQSAERAKQRGLSAWRTFCMYRLNRWLEGSDPWLKSGDWLNAASPFEIEDVEGLPAAVGLDLSKTRDMSALTATFVDGESRRQKTWLWITESYARVNRDKVSFEQWSEDGYLEIIPGEVIREAWIRERFEQLMGRCKIEVLVYDKTYAQSFVDWCEETWPRLLAVEFPQSSQHMEGPIDDFASQLISGTLQHDGNPCMTWQAGHCEVRSNAKGHRILAKPPYGDVRKIDGMVSSVMSLWGTKHVSVGLGPLLVF